MDFLPEKPLLLSNLSKNMNTFFNETSNGSEIAMFIEECGTLANELKNKSMYLKEWERYLLNKEKSILNKPFICDRPIKRENKTENNKVVHETNDNYSILTKKFNNLNRSYRRIQKSFEDMKDKNHILKLEIEKYQSNETLLNNEITKLRSKILSNTSKTDLSRKSHSNCATQTKDPCQLTAKSSKSPIDTNWKSLVPLMSVMRNIWAKLYQSSLKAILSDEPQPFMESMSEICLLLIPMTVENLRAGFSLNWNRTNLFSSLNQSKMMFYNLEMLHWSYVYLDIRKVAVRKTMMTPISRFAEELVQYLKSTMDSFSKKCEMNSKNLEIQILMLLVALRTVNQVNDLSLVLNCIVNLLKVNEAIGMFLSKFMFVPLLCRWCSTFNCCGSISSKIIHIVHQSMDQIADITLNNNLIISSLTGLDQIVIISTRMPIASTEPDFCNNYHILVLILDLLYGSRSPDKEHVIEILSKIIPFKVVRKLLKDLGLVGIITSLISKCSEFSELQTNVQCLSKLKLILNQLN